MALASSTRSLCFLSRLPSMARCLHVTAVNDKVQAGRYRPSRKQNKPLTYEMANPPHYIIHRKTWNSWNTSNMVDGCRPAETAFEDIFIRRFVTGTFHGIFLSEIIIKRQHNMIRVAGIIRRSLNGSKMYFLIGYTEQLLSLWLQCIVKLELQSVADKSDVIYKYI